MQHTIHNLGLRLMLTAFLLLGGFIFPLLFFIAAFVAWSIFEDFRHQPQECDEWFVRRHTATAADPNWKSYYLPYCESPAETAFLEAMIEAYILVADKGILRGNGITLDLQVALKPYRVDFLVNGWLVVEIDGAAYHSSPEAVARDKARDADLNGRGYSVLRIPAKIVFASPDEAVSCVRAEIAKGREKSVTPPKAQCGAQQSSGTSLHGMLSSFNKVVDEIGDNFRIMKIVAERNNAYANAFYAERCAIEKSVELAEAKIRMEQYMAQSDEHRQAHLLAQTMLSERKKHRASEKKDLVPNENIPKFTIPLVPERTPHPDPIINEEVEKAFKLIVAQRDEFFIEIRKRLNGNDKLKELVKNQLHELGCDNCWVHLS